MIKWVRDHAKTCYFSVCGEPQLSSSSLFASLPLVYSVFILNILGLIETPIMQYKNNLHYCAEI